MNKSLFAARFFSEEERQEHSTWRELANVLFSLQAFLPKIKDSSLKLKVDNQASVHIMETGSMKPDMQFFSQKIFEICFQNNIKLNLEWVPRDQNKLADFISRQADMLDTDDWGLTTEFFQILQNLYGVFTLDAFANFYNTKCDRFYSLFHAPNSLGVDAFTYDWHEENVLMVPLVLNVGRALHHLRLCKAKGVLVAPKWPSSHFWPLLMKEFYSYIKDVRVFKGNKVLIHGLNKNSLLGAEYFQGDIIVVALNCL